MQFKQSQQFLSPASESLNEGADVQTVAGFVEVARHLSFAVLPKRCISAPPAVSMQVKELESVVELPLFERAAAGWH